METKHKLIDATNGREGDCIIEPGKIEELLTSVIIERFEEIILEHKQSEELKVVMFMDPEITKPIIKPNRFEVAIEVYMPIGTDLANTIQELAKLVNEEDFKQFIGNLSPKDIINDIQGYIVSHPQLKHLNKTYLLEISIEVETRRLLRKYSYETLCKIHNKIQNKYKKTT